jgi:CheY-like chemotaxis protein
VLLVDDIATNLTVIKGLLAPYEMDVSSCLSGMEAIDLVKREPFDIVFMDHMMPEMNGVEATAAIRAMDGEYFKTVTIIALTANAISGMRDMFLANGFNDYLAKPIEIPKLNEIMERWIPEEKRVKHEYRPRDPATQSSFAVEIEGIDTSRGLFMTGGTVEGYIKVLETYCQDAEKRLEILSSPPGENGLASFTIQVHALKSASASIGADEMSRMAAELEEAGKNGDVDFITKRLAAFNENLSALVEGIKMSLAESARMDEGEENTSASGFAFHEKISRLRNALLAENVGEADAILEELEAMPASTKTKETLAAIADLVLTSEFEAAAGVIDERIY